MSISAALVQLVGSVAGVTSLIGTLPNMRFWPVYLRQASPNAEIIYPAITYQRVIGEPQYSHDGYSNLDFARWQLSLWTRTFNEGEILENALKVGLHAYRGTVAGVRIDRIFIIDGITDRNPTTQIHLRTIDLLIAHSA